MSLLQDDELSTLEAALEFIESYHNNGDASETASSSSSSPSPTNAAAAASTSGTGSGSGSDTGRKDSEGSPKRAGDERKARNAQASARSHRKKRAELLLLREEEAALRTQVATLKARKAERQRQELQRDALANWEWSHWSDGSERDSAFGSAVTIPSAYLDYALHQRRLRLKSEALNRKLRAALREQRSATAHFSQLLQKRLVVTGVSDLLGSTAQPWTPFASPSYAPLEPNSEASLITHEKMSILQELEIRSHALFVELDGVIASIESESASSSMQIKQHPEHGAFFDISSSVSLPCTVEDAWEFFSEAMCSMKDLHTGYYTFSMQPISEDALEKDYSLAFEDKARLGAVPVDGVSYLRTYRTKQYGAFLFESMIRPRYGGIQLRESGWIAVSRSPVDPKNRCIYQQHYRLFAELKDESSSAPAGSSPSQPPREALLYIKQFLLNSLAAKMRNDQRYIEDALRSKLGDNGPLVPIA